MKAVNAKLCKKFYLFIINYQMYKEYCVFFNYKFQNNFTFNLYSITNLNE